MTVGMDKVNNRITSNIMGDVFGEKNMLLKTKNMSTFDVKKIRTASHGSETISFLGSNIWEVTAQGLKRSENYNNFKQKISFLKPNECM